VRDAELQVRDRDLRRCCVEIRCWPMSSGMTWHFHVNESILFTSLHGKLPISIAKFEHSHCFCFWPTLPRMSLLSPLVHLTSVGWNSTSKYAGSLLLPSSAGTVTLVISASLNSSCDMHL